VPPSVATYRGIPDYRAIVQTLPDANDYFAFGDRHFRKCWPGGCARSTSAQRSCGSRATTLYGSRAALRSFGKGTLLIRYGFFGLLIGELQDLSQLNRVS
jgi:hypothetical protein